MVASTFSPSGNVALGSSQSGGLIVHLFERTRVVFHELAPSGKELSRRVEPSKHAVRYGILDSSVLRLHEDGSMVMGSGVSEATTALRSSRNSIVLPTAGNRALVVNQETGELSAFDGSTGAVTKARIQSPAIDSGIAYYEAMAKKRPEGHPAPGKGLVVLDAKFLQGKIYLLLSPYSVADGALVLTASPAGSVHQQWRLRFKSVDPNINPRYLTVLEKTICVASSTGSVGCFPIG